MVTVADVAARAGVAPSTVSQALSGHRPVNAETRARILAVASELGYRPNVLASNLRHSRTRTIGLAVSLDLPGRTLAAGPFSEFVEAVADSLTPRGYKLLCLISRSPETSELVKLAQEGHVDGLLLLQIRLHDARIAALRSVGLPFVAMGRALSNRGFVWVDSDLSGAAEVAVRHLLDRGHRRLAFLGDTPIFGYQYHALAGFLRAVDSCGLSPLEASALPYNDSTPLQAALEPFLQRESGPTALITTADLDAMGALRFFVEQGLRVPEDVAIVTLGDSLLTQLATPSITALCYSFADYCRQAVDLLLALIEGHMPEGPLDLVPMSLVRRESS